MIKKCELFNSLPSDKILDWTRLKSFEGDNLNVNKILKFAFSRVENIVEKGLNQHFLLFPQCFQKASICPKSRDCVVKSYRTRKQISPIIF